MNRSPVFPFAKLQSRAAIAAILAITVVSKMPAKAQAQRVMGTDISYWNGGQAQGNWDTAYSTGGRVFVFLRATRGGTTGQDQAQGTPAGGTNETLSLRYDDPRFVQNLKRATAAGMVLGPYHFARPDNAGNTGTDEADHFLQMAGAWMRPGYLMPMFDQEAGSGSDTLVQFANDFSDEIYAVMQIRPCIYINGNYSGIFQGASAANRDKLAKPASLTPSVVGPDYPMVWDAYPTTSLDIQSQNPKDGYSGFYGPWDDYGTTHPWSFWQHDFATSIPGFNNVDTTCDSDVSHGDIEYVRNYLVPAVWWNDLDGDWSTLLNWNCGQTPVDPVTPPDQATPYDTGGLPTARLPGAAGSGPTSGQYDTVILERPNANITVTVSTGTHNVRKLYMRETLNISGGSLTVNYDPTYRPDTNANVLHGGPVSAQFSGLVTISGSGSLSVHTLQVDTNRIFTLSGGTLALNTINLMPHSSSPAKILVNGDVALNAYNNASGRIAPGSGSGKSGFVDLGGSARVLTVGNGTAEVDVSVDVPITNGAVTKAGAGTLRFNAANTYVGGTTISAGTLLVNNTTNSGTGSSAVTVNSGGTLRGTGIITGAVTVNNGGTIAPGTASALGTLTLSNTPTLGGISFLRINNGGAPTADKLSRANGTLTYAGTLTVSNIGAALAGGEVFTNFSATGYAGAFAATNLPILASNLNWYLGRLITNGSIAVNRKPAVNGVVYTNTPGQVIPIPIASLLASATDGDGDPLSLTGFDSVTTNGIVLSSDSTYIYYSNNVNVADRFNYNISDNHGGSTTSVVQIAASPYTAPSIASGPNNVTLIAGQNATFSVSANGTSPFGYQWRFAGANLAGATNSSYTRFAAITNHAGQYTVVVTNIAGSVTSAPATLTVNFSMTAVGSAGGSVGVSPNQPSYTPNSIITLTATPNANYYFSSWSGNASGTNNPLSVTMTTNKTILASFLNAVAPSISTQPVSQSVKVGTNATFTVSATGSPAPGYQWRFNNSPIPGASSNSYTRVNVQTNHAGAYSVVITNAGGSVTSSNANLTVSLPQSFLFQSAKMLPDGRLRLLVTGESGASAWLERASNFTSWSSLSNFVISGGTFEYIDSDVTNLPQSLYRVRQ